MGIGRDAGRSWWRDRRVRWAGGVLVAAVVLASATAYALSGAAPEPAAQSGPARVDRGDVSTAVAAAGSVHPEQTRSLSFGVAGTVTEIRVRPGDEVSAGQVLAAIDNSAATDRVSTAQTALTAAQDALTAAQDSLTRGATLTCAAGVGRAGGSGGAAGSGGGSGAAGSGGSGGGGAAEPTPTKSATPTATASPTPSGQPHPSATPSAASTRTTQAAAPSHAATTCAGQSGSRSTGSGSGSDPVLRASEQVTSAELQLATARDQLAGTTITAPLAGKVLSVAGAVGGQVRSGAGFIELGVVNDMQVAADFPEADAGQVVVGLTATVTLANHPGEEFPAKVVQVDPAGTVQGQMVRYGALLAFDKPPAGLLVGQSANVRVQIAAVANVLRVPSTAVHDVSGGSGTVMVVGGGNPDVGPSASPGQPRQVTIGVRGDQFTEIKSGVVEGDEVVVNW